MAPATPSGASSADRSSLLLIADFRHGGLAALRRRVAGTVRELGLAGEAAERFLVAVNEAMTNAVRHGGGAGRLTIWVDGGIRCEISDRGTGFAAADYLGRTERPTASATGGMGLWIALQTADRLAIESGPAGTTVTITAQR
ncbi:ATP-binding protein [Asanoa sp. NPDC049573]|uniref:ATP-binding protein n=1 Tax=Asanoa sp. NPDC049573 TaxID=3155396 RepID=UPI003414DFEF